MSCHLQSWQSPARNERLRSSSFSKSSPEFQTLLSILSDKAAYHCKRSNSLWNCEGVQVTKGLKTMLLHALLKQQDKTMKSATSPCEILNVDKDRKRSKPFICLPQGWWSVLQRRTSFLYSRLCSHERFSACKRTDCTSFVFTWVYAHTHTGRLSSSVASDVRSMASKMTEGIVTPWLLFFFFFFLVF